MSQWSVLALELAQRAAEFGRERPSEPTENVIFIHFQDLENASEQRPWWWPNIPLIKALLENKENSFATFISLSNYSHDDKLVWVNFVADDYPKNNLERVRLALKYYDKNQDNILIMTKLLENLGTGKVPQKKIIFINFCDSDSDKIEAIHDQLLIANWPKKLLTTQQEDPTSISELIEALDGNEFNLTKDFIDNTMWYQDLTEDQRQNIHGMLKRYTAWLQYPYIRFNLWKTMLTVPVLFDPKHLPGTHCGAIHIYIRDGQWLSEMSQDEIIGEISSFAAAFWAGSTVIFRDDLKEFHRSIREVEKQSHMLQLLIEPLNSLTEAIAQTQQDTQTLRSILYDPHKVLFSVAPMVEKYFSRDEGCEYGRVKWKGQHTIDSMGNDAETKRCAAAMLAAIICRIYGRQPEGTESELDLYRAVEELLMYRESAFSELREALESLVPNGDLDDVVDELKSQLAPQLKFSQEYVNKDKIKELLKRLKEIIFTPFKYEGKAPLLPLAMVVFDYFDEEINLSISKRKDSVSMQDVVNTWYALDLFSEVNMLVPRYNIILSFVSGVLAYMKEIKETVKSVLVSPSTSDSPGNIKITFSGTPYKLDKLSETFSIMS